jgi:hypothetical protein
MSEPRFPPPGGQPAGYRDAGTPVPPEEGPRPPELDGPELPRGKRVVASRPDDPDVALAKAFTPPRRRRQQVSRAGVLVVAIFVIVYIAFQVAVGATPRPRRVSSPPCIGQHC